jgi:RHS repeat-associated protein
VLSQVPSALPGETTVADGYDFEDRLKSRTGGGLDVTVLYNGDGQRVAETVAGQTTAYLVDELNPTGYAQVVEERTNGSVTRTYTYGHDLLAQDTRESGHQWRAQFFGYDGHGSVRFLTDELGAVSDTYSYDAFGTLLTSSGTTANRYRYAGEEFAPELGLYQLRARWLNAAHGRFWSADTYEGQATDPASLHRYSYAHNNPANLSDPSGHTPTLAATMCNLGLLSGASAAAFAAWDDVIRTRGTVSNGEMLSHAASAFAFGAAAGVAAPYLVAASPAAAWVIGGVAVGGLGYSVYDAAVNQGDPWLATYRTLTAAAVTAGFSRSTAINQAYQTLAAAAQRQLAPYLISAELRLQALLFPLRPGTSIPAGPPALIVCSAANNASKIKYIGKMDDLEGIPWGQTLLDDLPDLGSTKANYYQNTSVLRKALRDGYEIRDASAYRLNSAPNPTLSWPERTTRQSGLGWERNVLDNKGFKLGPDGVYPPK